MVADQLAADADVREQLQAVADLLAAAGDRRERPRRRRAGRRRPARSPRRSSRSSSASASSLGSSGAKAGSAGSEPSTVCIAPDDLAELAEARRAARSGSSRARRARAPSRRAPSRTKPCMTPSVASMQPPVVRRTSRRAAAMFSKPRSVRKRSISSSGLSPGLEPAEHLEHQRVVEDDRGVGLLGAHRAARRVRPGRAAGRPVERDVALALRRRASPQRSAGRRVAQRVVDVQPPASSITRLASRRRARDEQLVEVVRAGGEARLDEREHERRVVVAQRARVERRRAWRPRGPSTRTSAAPTMPVAERVARR